MATREMGVDVDVEGDIVTMGDDGEVILASTAGCHGGNLALGHLEGGFRGVGGEDLVLEEGDKLGTGEGS